MDVILGFYYKIAFWVLVSIIGCWLFYLYDKGNLLGVIWVSLALWCAIGLAGALYARDLYLGESSGSGVLLPAGESTPEHPCANLPARSALLLLGNCASYNVGFPQKILHVDGEDLVTLKQTWRGISLSAKIYDNQGKIIAELRDNSFDINLNNYFRRERPDRSTLAVYDQTGAMVLNVRFVNRRAIRLLGVFYGRHGRKVTINEQGIVSGNNARISNVCFGNAPYAVGVGEP